MKKRLTFFVLFCFFTIIGHAQIAMEPFTYGIHPINLIDLDSLKQSVLLTGEFDFACIFDPGLGYKDFGFYYQKKTKKLVMKCADVTIHWPWYNNNEKFLKGVKFNTIKLKISDTLALPLTELYWLAVKTARVIDDTCDKLPIVYDAPFYVYYVENGMYAASPSFSPSECDTSLNVQRFRKVNNVVIQAIRRHDVRLIEEQLPEIQCLIAIFRKLPIMND